MGIIIDSNFKTQLTTAILSVPIVYIPNYHYAYIDKAIDEIFFRDSSLHNLFAITKEQVCEYDITSQSEISFCGNDGDDSCDLIEMLRQIANGSRFSEKKIFLIKGIAKKLEDAENLLALMRFASAYENFNQEDRIITVIIADETPVSLLPPSLLPIIKTIDIPLPPQHLITQMLKQISISCSVENPDELIRELSSSLKGLDQYQINTIINSIMPQTGYFLNNKVLKLAQMEKKQIVKKSGVLEVIESDVQMNMIGGLDVLRSDIKRKAKIFRNLDFSQDPQMRVTTPKGILILGMPGCGKSMIAKAISNEFGIPLLRLDIGRLMGQYVGLSEENLRKALAAAEAANPCILWIDEIEKAFAGSQNKGGVEDSLVVRLMGCFLTWMQERTSPVYIVATANDVMRPEFMRRGRFDEVYFVDFPKEKECEQILHKKIEKYTKPLKGIKSIYNFSEIESSMSSVADMMQGNLYGGFSGAEIESVVNLVIEKKFIDYIEDFGRRLNGHISITIEDFRSVINTIKPSVMANQKGSAEQPTSIERILSIQKIYNFKNASIQIG